MKRELLIEQILTKYPNGICSRKDILEWVSYIPGWMNEYKTGRGTYAFPVNEQNFDQGETSQEVLAVVVPFKPDDCKESEPQFVPMVDKTYVPFGNFSDLEKIIKSGIFYPTYITGPTGNGKSMMIEQICAKHKKPLIRVNLNMMSDEDQLIGSKTLQDGNIKIVEGPVLIAMRSGATLLLDEIDAGSANTLLCLQPILEGKPYYFKLKNEVIVPSPGFNIFATANTKGKGSDDGRYIGTNVLNEAFLERFAVTFEQDYPPSKIEKKIITNLMKSYDCENPVFAESLVKWAEAIRRTFDDGGVDENMTTRRVSHIIRAYSIFKKESKAIELCCNRFDSATKHAFIDLYNKVKVDEVVPGSEEPDEEFEV